MNQIGRMNFNTIRNIIMSNIDCYIFSTCRLTNLKHPDIVFRSRIKNQHNLCFTTNNIFPTNYNIITQPVNYTTKLTDVLDSIKYLYGLKYKDANPDKDNEFKKMFFTFEKCIPYKPNQYPLAPLEIIKKNKPGKCIIEIWSLDEYIFKSGQFKHNNLPFKINSCHRSYDKNLFYINKLNFKNSHKKIKEIKKILNCPILIVGPYLSLTAPYKVNKKRIRTQNILKKICEKENLSYFDMTEEINKNNSILIQNPGRESHETHFTDEGYKILSNVIYDFIK